MIVVFGSINIDLFTRVERLPAPGETALGRRLKIAPGGKGANQALAAKRAGGAEVRLVGRVGRDLFAGPALALLEAGGVELDRVEACDEPTGSACIAVDRNGENQIVMASGANLAADQDRVPDGWLGPETTLLLQMEVPPEQNWALVRRARAAGARIVLNAAPVAAAPRQALAQVDFLVVNEIEALAVAEGIGLPAAAPSAAGRALAEAIAVPVIVTLGGHGAVAFAGVSRLGIDALPVQPVDCVGAGDAFIGALAVALDQGQGLEPALHRASVAGGLACTVAGAQPSLPTAAAITDRLPDLAPAREVGQESGD